MHKELLLNHTTREALRLYIESPGQAVLLSGPAGSGKSSLAIHLAEKLLDIPKFADYPYKQIIEPENGSISIESIRQLKPLLTLKVPDRRDINQVVIILDSHALTIEAQNALLKLLEEPNKGTLIILTANNQSNLLPTIKSRVHTINVLPVSENTAGDYFSVSPESDIKKAYVISQGRVGLMTALLEDAEDHPLVSNIKQVKELLALSPYQQLTYVNRLGKDKSQLMELLDAFLVVASSSAKSSVKSQNLSAAKRWQNLAKRVIKAKTALNKNAQTKLVLNDLFLNV